VPARRSAWRRICAVLTFGVGAYASAFSGPAHADPLALWRIVHGACVPHVEAGLGLKPCERVDLDGGVDQGVAILKDLVGIAQMLTIPTRRITGIEDPRVLAARCRGKPLDWRSTRNGRAARTNCMSMSIAWRFRS
jgi:CDP-diacylglycerol pyrophosphatase